MNTLTSFIENMTATSSVLDKVALLESTDELTRKALYYAYNPFLQYRRAWTLDTAFFTMEE